MDEIIINDNIKITNIKNIFTINFKYKSYSLIKSLIKPKIIQGASTDNNYFSLKFTAQSVKTYKQFRDDCHKKYGKNILQIEDVSHMIHTLAQQLNYLITEESKTILGYNPNEIIVINDEKFAYIGSEFIANFDSEGTGLALISCPFSYRDFFFSPELLRISELPSYVHYKSSYFSLALLVLHSILETDDFYISYLNSKGSENILNALNNHPIKNTRIYWLLSRCLVEDPNKRNIIHL